MFTALVWVVLAGTPLGSPKPPVCTCCGGRSIVCGAELPVENKLVRTSCFGMTGAVETGKRSGFLSAIFTSGAGVSSAFGLGRGCGAARRNAAGRIEFSHENPPGELP